jgi:hypothetical protein
MKHTILCLVVVSLLLAACASSAEPLPEAATTEQAPAVAPTATLVPRPLSSFQLMSTAFGYGEAIPEKYSCKGENISPALTWTEPPAGTQSFALIMDDPDARAIAWDHWILYNIPADARELPGAFPANEVLADGSKSGNNSWGITGYGGPCPPSGTHRYFFKLYALDIPLDLTPGANKGQLLKAMEGHILGQAELMGTFKK